MLFHPHGFLHPNWCRMSSVLCSIRGHLRRTPRDKLQRAAFNKPQLIHSQQFPCFKACKWGTGHVGSFFGGYPMFGGVKRKPEGQPWRHFGGLPSKRRYMGGGGGGVVKTSRAVCGTEARPKRGRGPRLAKKMFEGYPTRNHCQFAGFQDLALHSESLPGLWEILEWPARVACLARKDKPVLTPCVLF